MPVPEMTVVVDTYGMAGMHVFRMLKKAVQQGRRRIETGGGTDRISWGRSPIQWILANGKPPPAIPPFENLNWYVEDFDEPRTKLADFFSILLVRFYWGRREPC
jgi:hypothetical protein